MKRTKTALALGGLWLLATLVAQPVLGGGKPAPGCDETRCHSGTGGSAKLSRSRPRPAADVLRDDGQSIFDDSVTAGQQFCPDCWAHGFGVALRSALLAKPDATGSRPSPDRPPQTDPYASSNTLWTTTVWSDESQESASFRDTSVLSSPKPVGHGQTAPPPPRSIDEPNWRERALQAAQYTTSQLSQMNGGMASPYIGLAKDLAERLGWGGVMKMRVLRGNNGFLGARAVPTPRLIRQILQGMRKGVRFAGYFGGAHAMAIVGVDTRDNTVLVSDSMVGGRVYKLPLENGLPILDGMIGIVAKDNPNGMSFLDQMDAA